MARATNRLSARSVAGMKQHGRHADGNGLYLVVDDAGKRWVLLFRLSGRRREMGLGPVAIVSLAEARDAALAAHKLIRAGIDPIIARSRPTIAVRQETFGDVALAYMADHKTTWRNEVHRRTWQQTLEVQAAALWVKPVAEIGTDDVLGVLRPMWTMKAETARRIRGRIERILDAARARKLRDGENPARWRGHLDAILPKTKKLQRGHLPAMPYAELPAFYARLCKMQAPTALALRFVILTASRAGEVRGMVPTELDVASATWIVPAERMKAKRVHRVALSEDALDLVRDRQGPLLFPSPRGLKLSDMAFNMLLRRMGHPTITTHGFRSTFRDWVDAETDFPGDLAEAALAHLVGDETERAYRRGDALEKRRHLMSAWARFVASASGAAASAATSDS